MVFSVFYNSFQSIKINKLTLQQIIFVTEKYFHCGNAQRTREEWISEYGDERSPPHRDTIYHLRNRFHQNGTEADLPQSGRPRYVRTPERADCVSSAFAQSPQKSAVRLSAEPDISKPSLRRTLHKNGHKVCHSKLIHGLLEDDADRRLQMCEPFISKCKDDSELFNKIT